MADLKKTNHKILNKKVLLSIANWKFNKFLSISLPLDFSVNIVTFFEKKSTFSEILEEKKQLKNSLDPIFSQCIYAIIIIINIEVEKENYTVPWKILDLYFSAPAQDAEYYNTCK